MEIRIFSSTFRTWRNRSATGCLCTVLRRALPRDRLRLLAGGSLGFRIDLLLSGLQITAWPLCVFGSYFLSYNPWSDFFPSNARWLSGKTIEIYKFSELYQSLRCRFGCLWTDQLTTDRASLVFCFGVCVFFCFVLGFLLFTFCFAWWQLQFVDLYGKETCSPPWRVQFWSFFDSFIVANLFRRLFQVEADFTFWGQEKAPSLSHCFAPISALRRSRPAL